MTRTLVLLPFVMFCGALLGLMIGGLWVQLQIGADMARADPFILVKSFPGWSGMLMQPWLVGYQITAAAVIATAILMLVLSISSRLTQYGQARFQTRAEMRRNGLLKPVGQGFVFAKLGKPRTSKTFIASDWTKFPNCLMIAPPGAGKGVGFGIPNTLLFPGSTVILDVKGEIFEATSRYRQAQGDQIFYFSPFDFAHASHRYNPLERIAGLQEADHRFTELSKLSTYFLITSEKGGASDFIVGARELFVAGGLLAIERGKPTIGEITRILFGGADKSAEYKARAAEAQYPQTKAIFTDFSGYADRTLSSYVSVLKGAGLGLWMNPRIDHVTSANDFSWHDLRKKPQSVYLVVNSDEVETLAPLLRLVFGEFIATMRSSIPDPESEPWPVGLFLDEFDQMGKLSVLVQALKQLRGHGVRVTIITQSIPGLEKHYDENERLSIEAAAGMKLYLSPNEKKTAGEVSEAIGKTTKLSVSDSISGDNILFGRRSISRRNEERALLSSDDVRRLDPNKVIMVPERQNPIYADRIVYYEDPFFKKIMKSQAGPLPYPDERHEMNAMKQEIASLREQVAQFRPLTYPGSDRSMLVGAEGQGAANTANAKRGMATRIVQGVEAAKDALSEEEAREALRPSDEEAIAKAAAFNAKLKSKLK